MNRRYRVAPSAAASVIRKVWLHPANQGRRTRQLAHVAAFQLRGRLLARPTRTRIGRSKMLAYLDAGSSRRAVYANPPDWPEMTFWRRVLGPGDLFVDVGANAGLYSLWALDAGARVVAVEPHPESLRQLRANLTRNTFEAEVVDAALSNVPGTMHLGGPDLNRQRLAMDPTGDGATIEVPVRTLDDVLGARSARGVKIDVEGAERLVLEGARAALTDGRIEYLQLEWNDCSLSLLGEDRVPVACLLEEFGYTLYRPDAAGQLCPITDLRPGPDVVAKRQPS